MIDRNQVIAQLRASDIRLTRQRVEIGQVLFGRQQHVTADDILLAVGRGQGHVSKATVYNTLRLFAEQGLLREVVVDPSKMFFDTNLTLHHHFYNMDTGELFDMTDDCVSINCLPRLAEGMEIAGIDVVMRIRRYNSERNKPCLDPWLMSPGAERKLGEQPRHLSGQVNQVSAIGDPTA